MKKPFLFFALMLIASVLVAQDTITGWTFPVNQGPDSLNANLGLQGNLKYDIRYEGTDTAYNRIYFTEGSSGFAAAASGWDNGTGTKLWSIKFKADTTYKNFKLFSKQSSDAANPGPRDWKIQWRLSGGTYTDVPDGNVTVADDWTTGEVINLAVPVTGQGTSSIYICWLMNSDTSTNGTLVGPEGVSKIDDIIVKAISTLGTEDIMYTNRLGIMPNPSQGRFRVTSTVPLDEIKVVDLRGRIMTDLARPAQDLSVDLTGIAKGQYILSVKFADQEGWYNKKFIIE